ncbi:MAG: LacI family transcriptional regulator [Opitutaceae bacterium]|jgi:LacI family transcriptional regulator|nr:LacI family transcriptional regulator [Opitutaceae bacterium]
MQPASRITLKTIAEKAGVHITTVSLALRNSPSLPVATRERLQALAREMGYTPDPALTALQSYRRKIRTAPQALAIAYLCFNPNASWKSVGDTHRDIYEACVRRCDELGYHLELIWVKGSNMSLRRCQEILKTRNPAGIVLSAIHGGHSWYKLDLSGFSSVRSGQGLIEPRLHAIESYRFANVKFAVRRAARLGYRRIGLAMMSAFDESGYNSYSGGLWSEQAKRPRRDWVMPFLPQTWEREPFLEWLRRERPEVVITNHQDNKIPSWLRGAGLRVPEDVGFIQIGPAVLPPGVAGIEEDSEAIGRTIIDKLVAIIHRNERGIPASPDLTLIEGRWRDGNSLRNLRKTTTA